MSLMVADKVPNPCYKTTPFETVSYIMVFYLKIRYTVFVLFVTVITTPSLTFIKILRDGCSVRLK